MVKEEWKNIGEPEKKPFWTLKSLIGVTIIAAVVIIARNWRSIIVTSDESKGNQEAITRLQLIKSRTDTISQLSDEENRMAEILNNIRVICQQKILNI